MLVCSLLKPIEKLIKSEEHFSNYLKVIEVSKNYVFIYHYGKGERGIKVGWVDMYKKGIEAVWNLAGLVYTR